MIKYLWAAKSNTNRWLSICQYFVKYRSITIQITHCQCYFGNKQFFNFALTFSEVSVLVRLESLITKGWFFEWVKLMIYFRTQNFQLQAYDVLFYKVLSVIIIEFVRKDQTLKLDFPKIKRKITGSLYPFNFRSLAVIPLTLHAVMEKVYQGIWK